MGQTIYYLKQLVKIGDMVTINGLTLELTGKIVQDNPELLDKKRILAITKSDLLDEELMSLLKENIPDISYVFISAITNYGLNELKDIIWNALES